MKGIRIGFVVALALAGLLPGGATPHSSRSIPRATARSGADEGLAARLRLQGKDPRLYLFREGSPLLPARKESIVLGDRQFDMVLLLQAIVITSGDWVERYLLLDEAGTVQDVATLCWPADRRFEIESLRCSGNPSEGFLEIRDAMPRKGRDNPAVPYVELGVEPGHSKRVSLSWTGSPKLGKVWIENGCFRAEHAKD